MCNINRFTENSKSFTLSTFVAYNVLIQRILRKKGNTCVKQLDLLKFKVNTFWISLIGEYSKIFNAALKCHLNKTLKCINFDSREDVQTY